MFCLDGLGKNTENPQDSFSLNSVSNLSTQQDADS